MAEKPTYEELEQRVKVLEKESFEQKRDEENLKHQKRRLESLIEYSSLAIVTLDEGHNIISCNRDFEKLFYFKESEIVGKNLDELVAGQEYIEDALSYTKETLRGKAIHGSGKRQRKDGAYIYVEIIGVPVIIDGKVIGAYAIYQDISDRKQAEETLRKSERFLQDVFDAIKDGISVLDINLKIVRVNSWIEEMYSKKKKFAGRKCYEVYQKRDTPCPWCPSLKTIETGETHNAIVPYPSEENPTGWIDLSSFPLRNIEGDMVGVIEYAKDITKQKRAEESLRAERDNLRNIFDSIEDGIYIVNQQYDIQYVNPILVKDFGPYEGVKCYRYFHDRDEVCPWCKNQDVWAGKTVHWEWFSFKNDRTYDLMDTPLTLPDGSIGKLEIFRDITERKRLEARLRQAQKMEALGTLGGGIAHDFNNLLMGIQGRTSLMMMHKDSSHPDFEHLQGIEEYVKSAADLTKQLLGFARGGKYEVKPTDINEMIKKSSSMFGRTKKEIKIHRKYQKDVWRVEADQGQIEQVLMNLYVNAWQAMPGGGDLYLQTENVTLDEDYVKPFTIEPGKYVKISVTDTGVGMDEDTRQRIFEPFFTTKEMGRGSGLGLASAYGIIKNHGGFINVYSEKGEGTTFNIYLPASESEVSGQKSEISDDVRHGDETLLLVDDEEMIIDVGEQLLENIGYTVLIAKSGKEATEIYEKNKDKIDMVILDMIMPDMSGGDTFDRLKEINPEIKVLLSSGYSINGQATEILERGCDGFIQKPFNIRELSHKIRGVLNNK